jgi:hypothetical protein
MFAVLTILLSHLLVIFFKLAGDLHVINKPQIVSANIETLTKRGKQKEIQYIGINNVKLKCHPE